MLNQRAAAQFNQMEPKSFNFNKTIYIFEGEVVSTVILNCEMVYFLKIKSSIFFSHFVYLSFFQQPSLGKDGLRISKYL